MIVRGMDGTFYEIPDDKTEEYKIPPAEVKEKLGATCGTALPNAPMGFQNVNIPSASGSPQVAINIFTHEPPRWEHRGKSCLKWERRGNPRADRLHSRKVKKLLATVATAIAPATVAIVTALAIVATCSRSDNGPEFTAKAVQQARRGWNQPYRPYYQ